MVKLERLRDSPEMLLDQVEIWMAHWQDNWQNSPHFCHQFRHQAHMRGSISKISLPWEFERFYEFRRHFSTLPLGCHRQPYCLSDPWVTRADRVVVGLEGRGYFLDQSGEQWGLYHRDDESLVTAQLHEFITCAVLTSLTTHIIHFRNLSLDDDDDFINKHYRFQDGDEFWSIGEPGNGTLYYQKDQLIHFRSIEKESMPAMLAVGFFTHESFQQASEYVDSHGDAIGLFSIDDAEEEVDALVEKTFSQLSEERRRTINYIANGFPYYDFEQDCYQRLLDLLGRANIETRVIFDFCQRVRALHQVSQSA